MIYEDVLREFGKQNVKYLLVGGIAVNLYGYARFTVDLDIMVGLDEENLMKLIDVMERLNYKPRVPVKTIDLTVEEKRDQWVREKGAVVFTFIHPGDPVKHIDIFLRNPVDFDIAYREKEIIKVRDIAINLISIDHLIEMKQSTGRPRDLEDINQLKRVKEVREKKPHGS